MAWTLKRMRSHHSLRTWQLAALLLAALSFLPSVPLAQAPPATPSSVTLTRANGTVTADWPAVSGATKYHVTYSTDNGGSWHAPVNNHTDWPGNSITFNADNAKTYVVGVRAGNDDGWSGWRNSPSSGPYAPAPPGPVASVTVTRTDGKLAASWPAVSAATHYHVTYTVSGSGNWMLAALNHTGSSIDVSGVDNAKTYVVGVRAGNADGWSGWVNSPAVGPYTAPGIIVQDSDGNAITALSVPEGGEASYQVKLASRPAQDVEVCIGLSVRDNNDADITFKGEASDVVAIKLPFTPQNWNTAQTATLVAAEDGDDVNGARDLVIDAREYYSGKVELTATEVDNDDITLPAAPAGLTATAGDGSVALAWNDPADSSITGYEYQVNHNDTATGNLSGWGSWQSIASSDADTTAHTVTGLSNGKEYRFKLRAINAGGASKPGPQSAPWYVAATPEEPPPPAPTNLAVTAGDGYLDISWDAVSDATGYDVRAKTADAADWHDVAGNITSTSHRYTTDDTIDYVAVRARDANGPGPWAELWRGPSEDWLRTVQQSGASAQSVQAQSQLAAPASITVTRDNNDRDEKLYVSWDAVSGASGYNLSCSHSDGWSWWHCGSTTSATSLTVDRHPLDDLSSSRTYLVAVRAVTSTPADASDWKRSEDIRPVMGWLFDLTTKRSRGAIVLSWTPNLWTTGYQIDCAEQGSSYTRCATLSDQDDTAAKHSVTISSWTAGGTDYSIDDAKTYDIKIVSTNQWGSAEMYLPLIHPSGLTASNVAQNAADITLAHASHNGDWYYKADKGPDINCQGPVSGTKAEVLRLAGGETYVYQAYSDRQCSTSSQLGSPAEFTTVTLTVSNVTQNGAMLTIAGNYASPWYYKRSSETACLGPVSLVSVSLTNLTTDTVYTYVAYSDSACTAANLMAASSAFTTNGISVSNLSESAHTQSCGVDSSSKCALGFTTGSNSAGYTLEVITAEFLGIAGDPGDLIVTLHADSSGVPADTSLVTLSGSNPNNRSGNGTYTCSGAGCALSASTTYFVQFSATKGTGVRNDLYSLATTLSDQQTLVPANNGWSLADKLDYKTTGNWSEFDDVAKLTLVATTKSASQTASSVTMLATVLGSDSPLNPAGADAQAANHAGSTANAHEGNGWREAASASATRAPGYVTNLASARSGDSDIDATGRQAVAFTTGPSPGGYTLKSVTAALRNVSGNADLVLTLHDMAGDTYGEDSQPAETVLATLSGSAPASGAFADVTYTCSGQVCDLDPDTTYFVVAESTGAGAYAWAYVASANLYTESTEPLASGWDIGSGHYSEDGDAWTGWGDWHHARLDFETRPVLSVGNLDEAPHQDACFPSGDTRCAVGFTTGPALGGTTLRAITARFDAADDPDGLLGDLVVALHAAADGVPGQALATLSGANPTEAGDYTYTCSGAGCVLEPDTTYFVQVGATAGASLSEAYAWSATLSGHETAVPAGTGWTLADGTTAYRLTWQTYPDVGLVEIFVTP